MQRCFLGLLICLMPLSSYGNCNLSVRVTEFKPQYYLASDGKWQGIAVDITRALFNQAKCDITFVNVPWKRALHLLEQGGVDLVLNMTATVDRKKYAHFIGPMLDETQALIVAKDSDHKITKLDDIKRLSKRIGIDRGVFYGSLFAQKMTTDSSFVEKFEYADNKSNMLKLISGRVLGILGNKYTASYRVQNLLPKGKFKLHPFVFSQSFVYFGFSKKSVSKKLLAQFERAYIAISQNGILRDILQKYQ